VAHLTAGPRVSHPSQHAGAILLQVRQGSEKMADRRAIGEDDAAWSLEADPARCENRHDQLAGRARTTTRLHRRVAYPASTRLCRPPAPAATPAANPPSNPAPFHHYRTTSLTPLTHNREILTAAPLNPTDHEIVRNRRSVRSTAHNDAELQIITVAGRHPQSASSHANGRMNMHPSNARYSALCG
jgi:hypothetical protein